MPIGNAYKYRPEHQAKLAASMADPEKCRRRAMYNAARGKKRGWVRAWNHAWARAGWPDQFPDFEEWRAEKRRTATPFEIMMIER